MLQLSQSTTLRPAVGGVETDAVQISIRAANEAIVTDVSTPTDVRDPIYLAAVAGTVSTGALFLYSALADSAPSVGVIGFVILWVFGPMLLVYEVSRRLL